MPDSQPDPQPDSQPRSPLKSQPPSPPPNKRSTTIQSVAIAARFLRVLAQAEGPLTLGEIAKRASAGSSTTHRYLQSLVREGLASQDEASGRYDLGAAALSVGIAALRRIDAVELAARRMKAMSEQWAASCGVAIWTDRGPTIVRWYRSAYFTISTVALGDVLPLDNTACGLVFQACLPPERVAAVRKLQPRSFRGHAPSRGELDAIHAAGGAALHEHLFATLSGMAAPVFDAQNEIACVITTVSMVDRDDFARHRDALFALAVDVSREAGARVGADAALQLRSSPR